MYTKMAYLSIIYARYSVFVFNLFFAVSFSVIRTMYQSKELPTTTHWTKENRLRSNLVMRRSFNLNCEMNRTLKWLCSAFEKKCFEFEAEMIISWENGEVTYYFCTHEAILLKKSYQQFELCWSSPAREPSLPFVIQNSVCLWFSGFPRCGISPVITIHTINSFFFVTPRTFGHDPPGYCHCQNVWRPLWCYRELWQLILCSASFRDDLLGIYQCMFLFIADREYYIGHKQPHFHSISTIWKFDR